MQVKLFAATVSATVGFLVLSTGTRLQSCDIVEFSNAFKCLLAFCLLNCFCCLWDFYSDESSWPAYSELKLNFKYMWRFANDETEMMRLLNTLQFSLSTISFNFRVGIMAKTYISRNLWLCHNVFLTSDNKREPTVPGLNILTKFMSTMTWSVV